MPKAGVLSLHASHIGFAHYLVARLNEHWIHLPAISDIEETVPAFDDIPQRLEGCCTAVTNRPCQNSRLVVIDCCPDPEFVALVADEGLQYTYGR